MSQDSAFVDNVAAFCRVLRAAGLPLGPAHTIDACRALAAVGLRRREDTRHALAAVLVKRQAERPLFDHAFELFWRLPGETGREATHGAGLAHNAPPAASRRLAQALARLERASGGEKPPSPDARFAFSSDEVFRRKDFAQMSTAEQRDAADALAHFRPPAPPRQTRRYRTSTRGPRIDMRATLRGSLPRGAEVFKLLRKKPVRRPAELVALCDISGSMAPYSRVLLHFLHGLARRSMPVQAFVFGTRLSNITRDLRHRDVDDALARVARSVHDWGGGTRIGAALHEFNRLWSRRLLSRGAVVLLITDGLDRAAGSGLGAEMERLHKSARRLIWLNPLLRYDRFEPKSLGIRAMLPHVDAMLPVHNADSVRALVERLDDGRFKAAGRRT